jgi:hypothetical protein
MKINWMMLALAVVVVTPAFADSGHGMGTGGGMMEPAGDQHGYERNDGRRFVFDP